jgi:hypothetical protein
MTSQPPDLPAFGSTGGRVGTQYKCLVTVIGTNCMTSSTYSPRESATELRLLI